jgi:hypothetical protein
MAKIDLKFLDTADECWISCILSTDNVEAVISIKMYSEYHEDISEINLDKATAIKFSKTLRTEINKIYSDEQ